jgi:hypothetical protein
MRETEGVGKAQVGEVEAKTGIISVLIFTEET